MIIELQKTPGGFTLSPKSNTRFNMESGTLSLFRELVRGSRSFRADLPICLIVFSCRKNIKDEATLQEGYEMIARDSNQPLIGYWESPRGSAYLDAVAAVQFIAEEDAKREGKKHGQEFIITIRPDGSFRYVETD